ncbi:MAG TPA: hypothetical protein VFY04_11050 [Solirubrobacterales bacterium]|nr:hypothetical protein [Solirubrobacterales bacterium]
MRTLRFTILLATLVAALALSACGEGGGSGGEPRETIDSATLEGIESGNLDLSLAVDVPGKEGGDFDLQISGPFRGGGDGELPELDFDATAKGTAGGEEIDFEGGLVLLPNTAFVNYEGTEYEVDPTTYSFIEPILNPAAQGQARSEGRCEEAVGELEVSRFIDNLRGGDGTDVEGTDTTKVSGDLDVSGALDALLDLSEEPACKAQTAAAGELPARKEVEAARDEIEAGVKEARIEVYVGEDDIVRQISAVLEIEPRRGSGSGPRRASIDFELKLSGVNEEQDIAAPQGAKPLNDLFLRLGINPLELLGLLEGEGLGEIIDGIGSAAGGGSGGVSQQQYLKCLGEVSSPTDVQKCLRLGR